MDQIINEVMTGDLVSAVILLFILIVNGAMAKQARPAFENSGKVVDRLTKIEDTLNVQAETLKRVLTVDDLINLKNVTQDKNKRFSDLTTTEIDDIWLQRKLREQVDG